MTVLSERIFGADFIDDRLLIARRTRNSGQAIIDAFVNVDVADLDSGFIGTDGALYFSVPENDAIIKKVAVTPQNGLTSDQLARFELAASLLDTPEKYYLESYESGSAAERLAIAYRRRLIDEKALFLQERLVRPSGFMLRSIALAQGYTHFCRHETEGVICLIDISYTKASYCFLGDGRPLLIGALEDKYQETDSKKSPGTFALDLAAVLQYQINSLIRTENRPPSCILISGQRASPEAASIVEQFIHIRTALPEMQSSLFADNTLSGAERNLVSLGLTVENQCV